MFRKLGSVALGVMGVVLVAWAAGPRYVQSRKVNLWAAPRFGSEVVGRLERGAAVEVLEEGGRWVRVRASEVKGWVPRMVLGPQPPSGRPVEPVEGGGKWVPGARRRASAVVGAGATRGVRGAGARERLDSAGAPDYRAVEEWERQMAAPEEVEAFQRELMEGGAE
ncbi:SH3 domain-containing protein [Deferrisoma camini]|uniref:SH3 domain-containing protein n=1 Tax=Deferrisoma camini TaxID=1035120 RepID=UPI00046D7284|nr:SH3 domain-containing protein [Deferrisoma camini]